MRKRELKKMIHVFLAAGFLLAGGGGKPINAAEMGENAAKIYGIWENMEIKEAKKPVAALFGGAELQTEEEMQQENIFRTAKDYRELLKALEENRFGIFTWEMNHYFTLDSANEMYGGVQNDGMAMPDLSVDTESSSKEYSDTNVQVEGIAEADLVKTDGEYLYILGGKDSKIFIVRAEDGALSLESSFSPKDTFTAWQEEMYVSGNRLAIVRYGVKHLESERAEDEFYYDWGFGYYGERYTQILIYDISDKKAPILLAEHIQDGDYVSSREKDGFLYIISEKDIRYNYIQNIDRISAKEREKQDTERLSEQDLARLPQVDDQCLSADRIYFREKSMDSAYTIVTSVCLEKPEKLMDTLSFLADSDHCYMSGSAIYLAACDWWDYGQRECDYTDIVKISYQDGILLLAAQGKVKGTLDDQFAMDEKDGYLRVVTTIDHYQLLGGENTIWQRDTSRSNALYVLDADLKLAGALEDLARDERVYSVRFLGDTAYFVTFQNTDPLFSVDLSDPRHPVLLGALKIPGFSDYLHPYSENLLLGIGYDTEENGAIRCVKLTMFDISNPREVAEKHTLLLEDYSTSEACSNHRAVLVDKEKNLIGLPLEGSSYGDGLQNYTETKAYAVYGYEEERGFYQKFEKKYIRKNNARYDYRVEPMEKAEIMESDNWYSMHLRGVYIGDYFYTINSVKELCSWQMESELFKEKERLELR